MKVRIWIDAAADTGLDLFGIKLLERHLLALATMFSIVAAVRVSLPPASPAQAQGHKLPFQVDWQNEEGTVAARLDRYLSESTTPVLAISADSTVDARLLSWLAMQSGDRIACSQPGPAAPVVLRLAGEGLPDAATLPELAALLEQEGRARRVAPQEFPSFIAALRRDLPFHVLPVRDLAERQETERFLFWASYKGSTDFLTKWVFPPLVWLAVRPLARRRVHPHWVTLVSFIATFAAIPFFIAGAWLPGLALAWLMAVLDSVDGKLARLTYTSSEFGRHLDHGLDQVHPPLWYLAWAAGLGIPLWGAPALMVALYILDRLAQALYKRRFDRALHTHSALDAALRTIIARRNPNLFIFTVGILLGQGVAAFQLVVVWQALTFLYHAVRTATALGSAEPKAA